MTPPFNRSVFVNCPFDEDYAPLLQAVSFCIVYLGFHPRLAPENANNAAARLDRLAELIRSSKFGIHDLSRCKSAAADEFARMNMPFELGLDHACQRYGGGQLNWKMILVLEHDRFDYHRALSDIAGWDIRAHGGDYQSAMLHVRSWLIAVARTERVGLSKIVGAYVAFQEWHWERETAAGSTEDDIKRYPTAEIVQALHDWMEAGQPAGL